MITKNASTGTNVVPSLSAMVARLAPTAAA